MDVAIIGGGVAGLNAARLLLRAGADVQLFEARSRLGGRVLTVDAAGEPSEDGFDLGPSWFWPRMQPAMGALVEELGLPSHVQHSEGDVVFERMSREPARRYTTPAYQPESMRFVGGSAALVRALAKDLPGLAVHLGTTVTALALQGDRVRIAFAPGDDGQDTVEAGQVVVAIPPRLLRATVDFAPEVPPETAELWAATPTWMAPHAKFFALYDRPFWREAGYSGTAQSMVGPMLEIHDATTSSGRAALFGFLGVGAQERREIGRQALTAACVGQFARLFGPQAAAPTATVYQDWAADPLTATPDDPTSSGHPAPAASWVHGPWDAHLVMAGSECSPTEAGYLAGAVEASRLAVAEVLRRLGGSPADLPTAP